MQNTTQKTTETNRKAMKISRLKNAVFTKPEESRK